MADITKDELDAAAEGQTVPKRFLRTVAAHPDQVALRAKDGEAWVEVTYREYADRVAVVTTALEGLGIGPGPRRDPPARACFGPKMSRSAHTARAVGMSK